MQGQDYKWFSEKELKTPTQIKRGSEVLHQNDSQVAVQKTHHQKFR